MMRHKVWISMGAAVFLTSAIQLAREPVLGRPLLLAAQGGEGGEVGVAYDANLPKNLRFFRDIQLIRGRRSRISSRPGLRSSPRKCPSIELQTARSISRYPCSTKAFS